MNETSRGIGLSTDQRLPKKKGIFWHRKSVISVFVVVLSSNSLNAAHAFTLRTTRGIIHRSRLPIVYRAEPAFDGMSSEEASLVSRTSSTEEDTTESIPRDARIMTNEDHDDLVPNVKQILSFAIPAVAIYLLSPLLSMIDTSTVGIFAGTAQQAALNPATAVADYSARVLSFLYAGTTNMVSVSTVQDKAAGSGKSNTASTFYGAIQLSLIVGLGLGVFLFSFANPLLRGIIGNDSIDPEVFLAASRYVRIRALGMPAAAVLGTSQAASLGMKDVRSPLMVIGLAGVVNLFLDLLLVARPQSMIGGAAGAAWATTASQYVSMFFFIRWLKGCVGRNKVSTSSCTHGILATEFKRRPLLSWPEKVIRNGFQPYVLPVTTTQVGRCSTYVAMGYVVSSCLGTVSMAANQVITSIFYSLIPIADSLGLTAQSFLPGILSRPSVPKAGAVWKFTRNLASVAGLVGVLLAGIVACIPLISPLFTTDTAVISLVSEIIPVLLAIFSLHGVFCASEGILLGQKDLKFLGRTYGAFFCVVPALILRLATIHRSGAGVVTLRSVWNLFLYYQLFRITTFVGRVGILQRRTMKKDIELL